MSGGILQGDRVVVCGGSSGIGLATARALGALGARVVIVGRSAERLEAALAVLGPVAAARTQTVPIRRLWTHFLKSWTISATWSFPLRPVPRWDRLHR